MTSVVDSGRGWSKRSGGDKKEAGRQRLLHSAAVQNLGR